jgi:hypothetical protein
MIYLNDINVLFGSEREFIGSFFIPRWNFDELFKY